MIIDSIQNARNYYNIHPMFAKAFDHIQKAGKSELEPGKYNIEGDNLKAILSSKQGESRQDALAKFECHDKHIDIQYCISGVETFGWKPRGSCVEPNGEYNNEKDVLFFNDLPDMFFQLHSGQFVIFFPEDVHAPMIGEDIIHKMVIKVKI